MPISAARVAAFETLTRVETTDAYASELLHSSKFAKLSPVDHGLLTELVMGVFRWRGELDEVISRHSRKSLSRLDVEVLSALRLGAYQLLFLTRIPAHAAINESVELVKRARKTSAAGMVNAVLRKVAGHQATKDKQTLAETRSPISESHGVRRPPRSSTSFSHPEWLVSRWEKTYGPKVAQGICDHDQATPPTALRLFSDHSSSPASETPGIQLSPGRLLTRAAVVDGGDIINMPAFRERRLVIQDEASQLVALLVSHGKSILDCCAAPGGKARILAQENPGTPVTAIELHARRAALLKRLVLEPNVNIVAADARTMPFRSVFDRILVDAPCSGTGTLARNPEIKWRLKPEDLVRLQSYQIEILAAAMRHLAPGGELVYSTCSLEPEENEQVIEKVMAGQSGFQVMNARERLLELQKSGELAWKDIESLVTGPYLRTIPGVHPCDGFFVAIIARQS